MCAGTTSDEYCGGNDKISAYEIESVEGGPEYIGCYGDAIASAMDGEEIYVESSAMTNEVSGGDVFVVLDALVWGKV